METHEQRKPDRLSPDESKLGARLKEDAKARAAARNSKNRGVADGSARHTEGR